MQTVIHARAIPVALTAGAASEQAFIAIIGACLAHAEANRPAVLECERPWRD